MDYSKLPEHLRAGMQRYIEHGIEPGSFLTAVLCNDLMGAMARSDETTRAELWSICAFLYNEAPAICFGSVEAFEAWLQRGGASEHLTGRY